MREGVDLMNVLSLFDGMSCGRIALDELGIVTKKYYASEVKNDALNVVQDNYPDTIQLGDVRKLDTGKLPCVDLLLGGSPCQDLSIAMAKQKRKGLKGDNSSLFYEYYRVLEEVEPRFFLLENVGSMRNKDKDIITELLGVEPIRINSKLVSAQLRNRYYWTNIPGVSQPDDRGILLNSILTSGWSDRGKARCILESESRPLATPVKMFHRYFSTGFTTLIFKSERHFNKCKEHYINNFDSMSAREIDKKILSREIDLSVYDDVRYLNQTELERLQTVPEGYTKNLSRNKSAGLLGDGWTVDVIKHILQGIVD